MPSPSRERVVCFEGEVAYTARFERVCSYPEARRLFSGSWSGTGQTVIWIAPPKLSTVYPRLRRTARRWLARGCEWERLTPCSSCKTRIIERLCLLA